MHTHALSIVVVDDNVDNAEMLAELLQFLGHAPRVAHDAAGALALLDEDPPQAVFLDLGLPDIDGCDVASRIHARFGAAIRLIALTGFSGDEIRERVARAGFDVFIVKPFLPEHIEEALAGVVPRAIRPPDDR